MATPLSGDPVEASDITVPRIIQKAGAETVTSSVTIQADNDFVIALIPGIYRIELFLHCFGHATSGDIRTAWATTGTITAGGRSVIGPSEATTDVRAGTSRSSGHSIGTEVVCGCDATTTGVVHEDMVVTCTVAGNLTLMWAQGTSSGTATTVSAASRCYITEIEAF